MQLSMFHVLLAVAIVLTFSGAASGGTVDSTETDCTGWWDKNLGQSDMNICATRDARAEQAKLKDLIGELRRKFAAGDAAHWKKLERNQKDWEQFVRNDCEWESSFSEGGSIQPMIHALCIANETAGRINRLRIFLCEGQGMTGECPRSQAYAKDNKRKGK